MPHQVTVYTKPNCTQCADTTAMLTKQGTRFAERNVEEDLVAREHVRLLGHQQVPVVTVAGGGGWSGFQPDKIAALAPKGKQASGFGHESPVNESIEWYTPPEVFDALGLTFDLDPCSPGPGKSFVPADRHYTIDDDGLASPWWGTVYVNPPYGPHTGTWLAKLAEHGDGIALVFARTDTRWFQAHAAGADLLCFPSGRIRFFKGNTTTRGGSPGAGSVLIAYGTKAVDALLGSGLGLCFAPARQQAHLAAAA